MSFIDEPLKIKHEGLTKKKPLLDCQNNEKVSITFMRMLGKANKFILMLQHKLWMRKREGKRQETKKSGVNFTNVLCVAFTHADPKSANSCLT